MSLIEWSLHRRLYCSQKTDLFYTCLCGAPQGSTLGFLFIKKNKLFIIRLVWKFKTRFMFYHLFWSFFLWSTETYSFIFQSQPLTSIYFGFRFDSFQVRVHPYMSQVVVSHRWRQEEHLLQRRHLLAAAAQHRIWTRIRTRTRIKTRMWTIKTQLSTSPLHVTGICWCSYIYWIFR